MSTNKTPKQRLLEAVEREGECWLWTRTKVGGYGRLSVNKRMMLAHRLSYEIHVGPIPGGMYVDHICFNKSCVNPEHLRLATHKHNLEHRDGPTRANKTSRVRGVYKSGKRWTARAGHAGKDYNFGTYDTLAEAEAAAIAGRRRLFHFPESAGSATFAHVDNVTDRRIAREKAEREALISEWKSMYESGLSTSCIAKQYGVYNSTVFRALQKEGIKFRGRWDNKGKTSNVSQ